MEIEDKRKNGTIDKIKESSWYKKIKSVKNVELIAAVFIIAFALVIYSGVSASKSANKDNQNATAVSGEAMSEAETKLASILKNIEGAGEVSVMISEDADGKIEGVLIVADGANDISVRLKLENATVTALGVDKKIVDVYKRA